MLRSLFNRRPRNDDRSWSAMHSDILEQISDRLSLVDYVRFRSVCKQWRSSPSDRSELVAFSKAEPWLILCEPQKSDRRDTTPKCYVYTRSRPRCCAIKLHGLKGAVVAESKLGWLLARRGECFFFYNPLTFSRINLPKLRLNVGGEGACAFAYLPTRRECTAVVASRADEWSPLELSMCRVGGKAWTTQAIPEVSSDKIGRIIRVSTCSHSEFGACSDLCPSPRNNTVFIYDPEKKNKMWYNFVTKAKIFVFDYSNERLTEEYKQRSKRWSSKLKEMRSKHGREWLQRSGGRDIEISFADEDSGTLVIGPRHVDERTRFDRVRASFIEPPKPAGGIKRVVVFLLVLGLSVFFSQISH